MAFQAVEFCEPSPAPGRPFPGTSETVLGSFATEGEAVNVARDKWRQGRKADTTDVMWWVVRVPGESLYRWIADRASEEEQILDLRTNTLIPLR